jgi:hypothetical protein
MFNFLMLIKSPWLFNIESNPDIAPLFCAEIWGGMWMAAVDRITSM